MSAVIQEKITQLEYVFDELNTRGMEGRAGAVWPVIIRRTYYNDVPEYEYQYPTAYFHNLQSQKNMIIPFPIFQKKSTRLTFTKLVIDKHMAGDIDIFLYHFGMFVIYGDFPQHRQNGDFTEATLGKKRVQFVRTLPRAGFMSTDEFISAVWSYQIRHLDTDLKECRINPTMQDVRILFNPGQFAAWTGVHYETVDWVEPLSGGWDMECCTWTKETDPMIQKSTLPEGWAEGPIILGHEGPGSYRHFVNGEPVHTGSAIQIKFGNGWISGRYEWSLDPKSKIQIHSFDDVFYINENHIVRVRG